MAALLALACGPSMEDRGDVYPRNCGIEGPVDLFEGEASTRPFLGVARAGERYLVEHWPDLQTREHWAVDRCGEERVRLRSEPAASSLVLGAAGDHVLSCDETTGAMAFVDPTGAEPPRPLFPAVEDCRAVPLGPGLAVQERRGTTVWFHPDPTDPEQEAVEVTREALVADPDWGSCSSPRLDCHGHHPRGLHLRAAGDELLVPLAGGELLAFSPASLASRILDPGPVFAVDVLEGGRHVVVEHDPGPTLIVDRRTGGSFEFCCWAGIWAPIELLGDWVVQGSYGIPTVPEPPQWVVFEARHVGSGAHTVIEGRDGWTPLARLTDDTALVELRAYDGGEKSRHVVWLATGEREPVDLPGIPWPIPGRDGVYTLELAEDDSATLRHLAGPGKSPRVLVEDARFAFPTRHGRILFDRARADDEPGPLFVMLPDERVVELDARVLEPHALFWGEHRPLDRDEVVYAAEDGDGWVLRRTVLP